MRANYDPNNDYDLGNRDCAPVQISVRSSNQSTTIEIPWDASAEQYIHAFYAAMIAETFHPESVVRAFRDFADEYSPEEDVNNE